MLERAAHGPEQLGLRRRIVRQSDGRRQPAGQQLDIALALEQHQQLVLRGPAIVSLVDLGGTLERLGQRPVGDALAVGQAMPAQDARLIAHGGQELAHQATLADAGRTEQGEQLAAPLADRVGV